MLGKGATVLTHEEVISSIEERMKAQKEKEDQKKQKAEMQRRKKAEKKQQGKMKVSGKKRRRKDVATDDEDSSNISGGSYCSGESRGSSLDVSLERFSPVSDNENRYEANGECDEEISKSSEDRNVETSVIIDDDSVNRYYAVIYTAPKKQYYWGKVTKVFSDDEEFAVNRVEMTFLHRKTLSSMPEKITWQWLSVEDKHMVDVEYIFMGPCSPDILKKGGYKFDDVKANKIMKNM